MNIWWPEKAKNYECHLGKDQPEPTAFVSKLEELDLDKAHFREYWSTILTWIPKGKERNQSCKTQGIAQVVWRPRFMNCGSRGKLTN